MRYVKHITKRITPQSAPIRGEDQVENRAGGFVYSLDKWAQLRRFLILGAEGNTYYASERTLSEENAHSVVDCLKEDGPRVVSEIADISNSGRAPKNDPAVFALALAITFGDDATKRAVAERLPEIARIGTHLFHFADAASELRGWGKMLRQAVSGWYNAKTPHELALQVVKYKQRDGWSHRDLLRLAHVSASGDVTNSILKWVARDDESAAQFEGTEAEIIWASEEAMRADKPRLIELITRYDLPREVLPTDQLKDPDVWAAMLPAMGLTALIRNLANMTRCGLIGNGQSDAVKLIAGRITDQDALVRARVHPIQVLSALTTYSTGRGARSRGEGWTPNPKIVDALDDAFYKAFRAIKPTGKRYMLALDVSGSMACGEIAGVPGLTPRAASAAMAMVTQAVEDDVQAVAFTSTGRNWFRSPNGTYWADDNGLSPIDISKRRRLDDVLKYIDNMPFGGTDCALPMIYATERKIKVDVFVVYTDNETWAGTIHPSQALRRYREMFNRDAKLVVVGMVANKFSIADPNDAGMLDIVGFDTSAPALMADFARGEV